MAFDSLHFVLSAADVALTSVAEDRFSLLAAVAVWSTAAMLGVLGMAIGVALGWAHRRAQILFSATVASGGATASLWLALIDPSLAIPGTGGPSGIGPGLIVALGLCLVFGQTAVIFRQAAPRGCAGDRDRRDPVPSALLNGLSHELRTPLNGILGFSQLLKQTEMSDTQSDYLAGLQESGDNLMRLTEVVLELLRFESGRVPVERGPADPAHILETICDTIAEKVFRKGLELGVHLDPGTPALVQSVPDRLQQCILLLVESALERTGDGGIGINLSHSGGGPGKDGYLRVRVFDTGLRLPKDCLSRNDEATENAGLADQFSGVTDIRLTLVGRIVDQLGGELSFLFDTCNCFSLTLPAQERRAPAQSLPVIEDLRLLAVTANPVLLTSLRAKLNNLAAGADFAMSALEAYEKLAEARGKGHPYDIVIVDQVLPGSRGTSLIRSIRGDARLAACRVMYLWYKTEQDFEPDEIADSYVRKPVTESDLYQGLLTLHRDDDQVPARDGGRGVSFPLASGSDEDKKRILVLTTEDRRDLSFIGPLHKSGYAVHVTIASTGVIGKLQERCYQALILDLDNLWTESIVLSQRIRAMKGEVRQIPILGVVRTLDPRETGLLAQAGLNDLILEPVDARGFLARLSACIGARGDGQALLSPEDVAAAYLRPAQNGGRDR